MDEKIGLFDWIMLYICRLIHAQQKSVSTHVHEGAFSSLLNLLPDIAPEYLTGLISCSILR